MAGAHDPCLDVDKTARRKETACAASPWIVSTAAIVPERSSVLTRTETCLPVSQCLSMLTHRDSGAESK